MLYQWLFVVVTGKKIGMRREYFFQFLARSSEGPATWLVKLLQQQS